MTAGRRIVYRDILESALEELSDIRYQRRIWLRGDANEVSTMSEAVAALFNDSGLDTALAANGPVFTAEVDAMLRDLRLRLRASLERERVLGTSVVIESSAWCSVMDQAAEVLRALKEGGRPADLPGDSM